MSARHKFLQVGCVASIAAELWSSYWLLQSIPTDSVLTSYPTTWSYVGEHFLAWAATALPIFLICFWWTKRYRLRRSPWLELMTVLVISCISELISSAYLWFIATLDGEQPKLWFESRFWAYMRARVFPWLIAYGVVLLIGICIEKWRHRHVSLVSNAGESIS